MKHEELSNVPLNQKDQQQSEAREMALRNNAEARAIIVEAKKLAKERTSVLSQLATLELKLENPQSESNYYDTLIEARNILENLRIDKQLKALSELDEE